MTEPFLEPADYEYPDRGKKGTVWNRRARVTGGDTAAIVGALRDGIGVDEIAEETGRDVPAIKRIGALAGIPSKDLRSREDRFRAGLYGHIFQATDAQAAEICGTTVPAMESWRRRHGVKLYRS
jgi:hypothetical protein